MIMKNYLHQKSKSNSLINICMSFISNRIERKNRIANETFFFFDIDDRLKGKFDFLNK
jgi:hypothetical protein